MGKGRFVNQKLGKRVSRKVALDKARLQNQRVRGFRDSPALRLPKKGPSRQAT